MSMTTEQVVAQQQHDVFMLHAQVAAESALTEAVCAINNLARSSEGILWQRGFSTVVEEDGRNFRWCDQGV